MDDKDTLYARWHSNELTKEELDLLRKEGAIDELEQIVKVTDRWSLPKYDASKGLEKFKATRQAKIVPLKRNYFRWVSGVAAAFVLFFALFQWYGPQSPQVMMASNGSNEQIPFVDGTMVTLNDGSSISYHEDNWEENRDIELTGEALFEVEKGSPFVVTTQHGSIKVLGTKFNVRAWGDNLYVACYEGSVLVNAGGNQTTLIRNEGVHVIKGQMNSNIVITNTSPTWSVGTSRFYEEPISEVIAELERQYDVSITMPQMTQTFSGIFTHDDIDAALRSVCLPLGLKYELSADKKEVLIQ